MASQQVEPEEVTLNRRDRRRLELRARILEVATELFDRDGFEATKVASICEGADIAHKTFFNHFPTKQELLREIASIQVDTLLGNIEEARKSPGSTRERIEYFFERIAQNVESAGPMRREFVTAVVHAAHEARAESEQAAKLHAAFGAIICDGIANQDVTDRHDSETLIDLLMGAFYALMFNWANLDEYPLRRQARATARLLGEAICVESV